MTLHRKFRVIRGTVIFVLLILSSLSLARIPHFDAVPSDAGLTGGIDLPGTGALKPADLAFGVHGSRPKANFGLPLKGLEIGAATLFRSTGEFKDLIEDGRASLKYRLPLDLVFHERASAFGAAGGVEVSGARPRIFGLISFLVPRAAFWKSLALELTLGGGTGRFSPLFGTVLARVHKQAAFIVEAEGARTHGGARLLLSQNLRLDIFLLDLATPLGETPVREVFRQRIRIGVSTTVAPWRRQKS